MSDLIHDRMCSPSTSYFTDLQVERWRLRGGRSLTVHVRFSFKKILLDVKVKGLSG